MLSRTIGVMFKVKKVFTKNYIPLLQVTLFLICCNSYEVIRSMSLKIAKSYQNNQVRSNKKLLEVSNSFLLYSEMT